MKISLKPKVIAPNPNLILGNVYLNSKKAESLSNNKLLNAALYYAKLGLPVFPLHTFVLRNGAAQCSCREWRDCSRAAKHPKTRFGHKEATTNLRTINDWWMKHPDSNIGLVTGVQTGFFVLDVDWKNGGEYSLEYLQEYYKTALKDKYTSLPATLITLTGSGGRHLYFKFPTGLKDITGSASEIGEGLDIRANENYIIAPPSKHISGSEYSWFGVNTPIEDAPDWLIYEIIKSNKPKLKINTPVVSSISKSSSDEKIPKGKRYDYLFRHICGLVNSYTDEEILNRAKMINDSNFETPLPEKEVRRLVTDICKRYETS